MRLPPLVLLLLPACGTEMPQSTLPDDETCDLFPLAVGWQWTYVNRSQAGVETDLDKEITECREVAFADCTTGEERVHRTWVQASVGADATEEAGLTFLEPREEGVVRVRQEIYRDGALDQYQTYSPYFMRLVAPPWDAGRADEYRHDRCEFDETGNPSGQTLREYRHEIVGAGEVTVPAGTFEAVQFERTDLGDGDRKRFWYACGVGKVLEQEILEDGGVGGKEELVSFAAGDGTCP